MFISILILICFFHGCMVVMGMTHVLLLLMLLWNLTGTNGCSWCSTCFDWTRKCWSGMLQHSTSFTFLVWFLIGWYILVWFSCSLLYPNYTYHAGQHFFWADEIWRRCSFSLSLCNLYLALSFSFVLLGWGEVCDYSHTGVFVWHGLSDKLKSCTYKV